MVDCSTARLETTFIARVFLQTTMIPPWRLWEKSCSYCVFCMTFWDVSGQRYNPLTMVYFKPSHATRVHSLSGMALMVSSKLRSAMPPLMKHHSQVDSESKTVLEIPLIDIYGQGHYCGHPPPPLPPVRRIYDQRCWWSGSNVWSLQICPKASGEMLLSFGHQDGWARTFVFCEPRWILTPAEFPKQPPK